MDTDYLQEEQPIPRASRRKRICVAVLVAAGLAVAAAPLPDILGVWQIYYPDSVSEENAAGAGDACMMCHFNAGGGGQVSWNEYGQELRDLIEGGAGWFDAFGMVEANNSDGDPTGATNLDEITAGTQPGWTAGPNNTVTFINGSTQSGMSPPAGILGDLDPQPASPWTDLGQALAGTHGDPLLTASGTLQLGDPVSLMLTNALESTSTYFVVGINAVNLPFYGGTLVPNFAAPFGVFIVLPVNGAGELVLGNTWPSGVPGGTELFFQHWILDAGGPFGFSSSNAVSGVVP